MKSHGLTSQDVPICLYRSWKPNSWVIEACLAVDGDAVGADEIHLLEIPGGQAATLVHEGPYEELGLANRALEKWFKENGRKMTVPPYERYITDPSEETDPAKVPH